MVTARLRPCEGQLRLNGAALPAPYFRRSSLPRLANAEVAVRRKLMR